MVSRKSASVLASILAAIVVAASIAGYSVLNISTAREVSIKDINLNPQSFNNTRVRVFGYVVNTSCYMFGPKYVLRDSGSEIALSQKNGSRSIDFAKYVSFILESGNYSQTKDMMMSIVGRVLYIGFVTDVPSHYIEAESAELESARWDQVTLETQQIRVEVEKTRYSVGEPVRFRVFNRNLSYEPIFAGVTNIALDISNSKGESVFGVGCDLLWPSNFIVNPGEEIELTGVLPSWNQTNNKKVQVPLGPYTVSIEMDAIGGKASLLLKITISTNEQL